MIYSCTLFYNEFDLLDVKIKEEVAGGVDRVVVVEASRTHQNKEKPLHLGEHASCKQGSLQHRKVDYITVGKEFNKVVHPNARIAALQREAIQRNAALQAFDPKDDDVVISADVDEILHRDEVQEITEAALKFGFIKLICRNFNFKINLFSPTPWYCSFAVSGKFLRMGRAMGNPLTLNRLRTKEGFKAKTNGNHFSFVMTPEQIADKLQAYSHVEFNDPKYLDPAAIAQAVAENRDICERDRMKYLIPVEMDETWPLAMLEDLEKWAPFIAKPACKISALKLPEVSLHPMPDLEVDFYKEVNDLPS
jgi:beta-1,4-mannosyl-glycoprotein beta-1,4-N-acetylglucosaminyltransferase